MESLKHRFVPQQLLRVVICKDAFLGATQSGSCFICVSVSYSSART